MQQIIRCTITNKRHPHFGKLGTLSGISVTLKHGVKIFEVCLDDGKKCFVKNSDAKLVPIIHNTENR